MLKMLNIMKIVMVVTLCVTVMAGEPKGCTINHLTSRANGESWTPSFRLQPRVTIALRHPNSEPWQEIDIEFESKTIAKVGTLKLKNTIRDSELSLTLSSMATNAYKQNGRSQTYVDRGRLKDTLSLEDWTYIDVSTAGTITVSVADEKLSFSKVNAEDFTYLYVRVPEGQDLDVGFNCTEELLQILTTPLPGAAEGSSIVITIVGIIGVLLLVGMGIFWYMGRRRNARNEKKERDARNCEECGDLVHDDSSSSEDDSSEVKTKNKGKKITKNYVDTCDDCGDVITEDTAPYSKDKNSQDKANNKGVKMMKNDVERCDDCGDVITEDTTQYSKDKTSEEQEKTLKKYLERCDDCGDVVDDDKTSNSTANFKGSKGEKKNGTKPNDEVDGECSCSDEEHD